MPPRAPTHARTRFGLRTQLVLALGVIGVLLAAVIAVAFLTMTRIHDLAEETIEVEGRLNRLASNVVVYTQQCRRFEKEAFLNASDRNLRDYSLLLWDGAYFNLSQSIKSFAEAAVSEEDKQRAATWIVQSTKYSQVFKDIKSKMQSGEITRPEDANAALGPFRGQIQELTDSAQRVSRIKSNAAEQAENQMLESIISGTRLMQMIGLAALVIAVIWSVIFPLRLMRPITALQQAFARLTGGDLSTRSEITRSDELGALAQGFDEMAMTIQQRTQDLESQHTRANIARLEAETARAETAAQLATIEQQRTVIREMSVPILPLTTTTLVLPLIGALDTERLRMLQEQALREIERTSARNLILDITGVPVVDTQVAQGLMQVVQAARLLGAEVVLVGIRPEVAQTVVGLGLQMSSIATQSTLQSGIAHVLRDRRS